MQILPFSWPNILISNANYLFSNPHGYKTSNIDLNFLQIISYFLSATLLYANRRLYYCIFKAKIMQIDNLFGLKILQRFT